MLDKAVYKVGTIDDKNFFTEGDLGKYFTGDEDSTQEYTGKYELLTLENLTTGETHVWGVEFEVNYGNGTEIDQ